MDAERLVLAAKALDNKEKLKIIDFVYSSGQSSITDITKKLELNFSTAHKYLNQLEKAGLLSSAKKSDAGRVKKLYKIREFDFSLSPEALSAAVKQKEQLPLKKGKKQKSIRIIGWHGHLLDFDLAALRQKCLEEGIPARVLDPIIKEVSPRLFDGMLVTDLQQALTERIASELQHVQKLEKAFSYADIFTKHRNLLTNLGEKGFEKIVRMHLNSDINIRNIGILKPINLVHNLDLVLRSGLSIVGLDAKPPQHLSTLLSQIKTSMEAVQKNLADFHQTLDFFNIVLAPYFAGSSKREIEQFAQELIYSLNQLHALQGIECLINLEAEMPKFLAKQPAVRGGKEVGIYSDFEAEANAFLNAILETLPEEKDKLFPKFVLKIRSKKNIPKMNKALLGQLYFANLCPEWQTENANYSRDWTRIDSSWKGWNRTVGVSQMQYVTLNLPRAGLKAKKEQEAYEIIGGLLDVSKQVFVASAEEIYSKGLSELSFLSKSNKFGKFCHFDDGLHLIGLIGLTQLVQTMNKSKELDIQLAKKIVSFIKKKSDFKTISVRTALTENKFYPIQHSFTNSNNAQFKCSHPTYLGGIQIEPVPDNVIKYNQPKRSNEEKLSYYSELHPLLLGGHMCAFDNLNQELLEKAASSGIGLFCDKKSLLWP